MSVDNLYQIKETLTKAMTPKMATVKDETGAKIQWPEKVVQMFLPNFEDNRCTELAKRYITNCIARVTVDGDSVVITNLPRARERQDNDILQDSDNW